MERVTVNESPELRVPLLEIEPDLAEMSRRRQRSQLLLKAALPVAALAALALAGILIRRVLAAR